MARQQALEQRHRPAFQRLGQQRVVGVGECAAGDVPGGIEIDLVNVGQQPHQLGHRHRRMGVVELDRRLVGQRMELAILVQVAMHDILQRGGGEEIFLPQPQLLPGRRGVGRIEHLRQALGLVALAQRAQMVARVEGVEQDRIDGHRRPQPQRVDAPATPAGHRRVIGHGEHALLRLPDIFRLRVALAIDHLDHAAEADLDGALAPPELPGIAMVEPCVGQLDLPAVGYFLPEQAVHIADAVAMGGDVHARHGFHEACGEPPEAAIAERGVGLQRGDDVEIDAELRQRGAQLVHQAEIRHGVAHQPADQEFQREIIDTLAVLFIGALGRGDPAVHHPVPHHLRGGVEPVVARRDARLLADAIGQRRQDFAGEAGGVGGFCGNVVVR